MDPVWRTRSAALLVLLTVLINWTEERPGRRVVYFCLALLVHVLLSFWTRLAKLPRDVKFFYKVYQTKKLIKKSIQENLTLTRCFTQQLLKNPDKICIFYEGQSWSFSQVDAYSNRVARLFHRAGVGKGVALMMTNRPEYVCIWLGLAKIGAATALINYNLRGTNLLHCISIARPKALIFGDDCADAVREVRDGLNQLDFYQFGGECPSDTQDFEELLRHESDEDPVGTVEAHLNDPVVYVYTSGTTGLPKAVIIPHARFVAGSTMFLVLASMSVESDVVYSPMPLYHGASGVYGVGLALVHGIPIVTVKKFSASRFWSDCVQYKATYAQYIGEICRYLLAAPPGPAERQHRVRGLIGNGLQPSLWPTVRRRFGIANICELYASTEGNVAMMNSDNTPGAVGFLPRILPLSAYPVAIVQVDPKTGEPFRDPITHHCVRCEDNVTGMIIGKIDDSDPTREFRGYLDREATQKKVLRNVFVKGDRYFMSGDLLSMDEYGYIYFKDRTGDTFRWRGENVSTAEVESVMSTALSDEVKSVAVYGVKVPGTEGKAGMAVIVDATGKVDADSLEHLALHVQKYLPPYARPLFVRVAREVPVTGTLKIKKEDLQKEGFDIKKVKDPVYFFDSGKYVPLHQNLLDDINGGRVRL